jgi:hypothetical protein
MHRLVLFHAPFEDPTVGAFLAQNMLQSKEAACVQNVCKRRLPWLPIPFAFLVAAALFQGEHVYQNRVGRASGTHLL